MEERLTAREVGVRDGSIVWGKFDQVTPYFVEGEPPLVVLRDHGVTLMGGLDSALEKKIANRLLSPSTTFC
jgi:hypothetical protein